MVYVLIAVTICVLKLLVDWMSGEKVKCSIVSSSGDNDKRGHLNSKNADKGVLNGDFKNKIFEKGI